MAPIVTLEKMLSRLILLACFSAWLACGSSTSGKPNILFIFMDDLDLDLGSLEYLPSVRENVGDQGKCF